MTSFSENFTCFLRLALTYLSVARRPNGPAAEQFWAWWDIIDVLDCRLDVMGLGLQQLDPCELALYNLHQSCPPPSWTALPPLMPTPLPGSVLSCPPLLCQSKVLFCYLGDSGPSHCPRHCKRDSSTALAALHFHVQTSIPA